MVAALVLVAGCGAVDAMRRNTNRSPAAAPAPPPPVRPADVAAWEGAPRLELETHPFFSTLERRVTPLSDGRELWDYPNGVCHNQFFVAGSAVQAYRLVGNCRTDCSLRPVSRGCSRPDLEADARAAQDEASRARWQRFFAELARQQQEEERRRSTTNCRPDGLGGMRCETR